MRRNLQFTIYNLQFFLLFFIILFFPTRVLAQGNEFLPAGQVIEADYIRAGEIVQIDGEIKGDAFLVGGVVTVNGKIGGDLFVIGGKVNVNGPVGNSIRIVAGDATVGSGISRNSLLICGNCTVTKQAVIGGSLIVAGGNLEVLAPKVGRGFRFFGSRLFLNSEVANEAFVVADREFLLGPQASITGNLKYTGNEEVVMEKGATVGGNIAYQKRDDEERYPRFFGARTLLSSYEKIRPVAELIKFFVSAVIGFILLGLFPRLFEKVVRAVESRPYGSLGWGAIVVVGLPVVAVLFAVTIVGIPVAMLLGLLGYLVWLAGQYLAAFFIGRKALMSRFGERRGWALVVGLGLIYILGLVPVLGGLIKLVLVLLALGGLVLAYKQPVIVEQRPLPFESGLSKQFKSRRIKS